MKRRALGKGLSSLLPERQAAAGEKQATSDSSEGYIQVPLDEVVPNPSQPRSHSMCSPPLIEMLAPVM